MATATEKLSEKGILNRLPGMVNVKDKVAVPALFEAVMVEEKYPADDGVPVMIPVVRLMTSPGGRLLAVKFAALPVTVGTYRKAVARFPRRVMVV